MDVIERAQVEARRYGGTPVRWWTALDNYEPVPRRETSGLGVRYAHHPVMGAAGFKFWPGPEIRDAARAVYILDDGVRAVPYYVAGWTEGESFVVLRPFPVNPDGDTTPDGRGIDFSTWVLGPRRCYHFKISEEE